MRTKMKRKPTWVGLDLPGTHYADSKNIVVRSVVGTDSYTSWRTNLRDLLKTARSQAVADKDEWHRFGYGIVYDAVGWTPGNYTPEMYGALLECGALLTKKRFDEHDLRGVRVLLRDAGFNLVPDWSGNARALKIKQQHRRTGP